MVSKKMFRKMSKKWRHAWSSVPSSSGKLPGGRFTLIYVNRFLENVVRCRKFLAIFDHASSAGEGWALASRATSGVLHCSEKSQSSLHCCIPASAPGAAKDRFALSPTARRRLDFPRHSQGREFRRSLNEIPGARLAALTAEPFFPPGPC